MRPVALLLLLSLLGCSQPAPRKGPLGKVVAVVGEVTVTRPGQAAVSVAVGLELEREMVITTAKGAQATLLLWNGYTVTLEEEREQAVAKLAVLERPKLAGPLGERPVDPTAGAGRQGERQAGESSAELAKPEEEKVRGDEGRMGKKEARAEEKKVAPPREEPKAKRKLDVSDDALKAAFDDLDEEPAPPAGPDEEAARAALRQARVDVLACSPGGGRVAVRVTFDRSGRVKKVTSTSTRDACVAARLEKIEIPPWTGDPAVLEILHTYQ